MFKRNSFMFLSFAMAYVSAMAQSGSCGDNVMWRLDGETLIISGEGPMNNYWVKSSYHQELKPSWYPFVDDIRHVVIEPGVTSIGSFSFYDNSQIETVSLPEGITQIGPYAFASCIGLTEIILPESLEEFWVDNDYGHSSYVKGNAFDNCTGLTSVTLPRNIKVIGSKTFCNCTNLRHVVYSCEDAQLRSSSTLNNLEEHVFMGCPITSVEFTSSVKVVPARLFENQKLVELKTGGSIEIVWEDALDLSSPVFVDCKSGSLMIDHALYAYYPEAPRAFSLTLPEGVTSISPKAIKTNPKYMFELNVPKSFYAFCTDALAGCTSLTNLVWNAEKCDFFRGKAFGSSLFSVVFGSEVKQINSGMLSGCSGLKKLEFPESLEVIETGALNDCSGLTSLTFPDKLEILNAQGGLSSLKELYIGKALKKYDGLSFGSGVSTLESVYWNAIDCESPNVFSSNWFKINRLDIGPDVENIPRGFCGNQKSIETIGFSEGSHLKSIGQDAFSNCSSLRSLTFPYGLETIGREAFANCTSLENISFPKSLDEISYGAFNNCSSLIDIYLPEGITKVLGFRMTNVKNFFAPSSIEDITTYNISVSESVILAFNHVPNEVFFSLKDSAKCYVPYPEIYNQYVNWRGKYNDGEILPLVNETEDAVHEFINENGTVVFDSKGLVCNVPGYEVTFDFEANGLELGNYEMVKACFSGANEFSAMIPFKYTIKEKESSIPSVEHYGESALVGVYDITGRKIGVNSTGLVVECRSDGTVRKVFR